MNNISSIKYSNNNLSVLYKQPISEREFEEQMRNLTRGYIPLIIYSLLGIEERLEKICECNITGRCGYIKESYLLTRIKNYAKKIEGFELEDQSNITAKRELIEHIIKELDHDPTPPIYPHLRAA